MNISKRLVAVADYVEDHSYIIDIGCDHALLDIYLVNQHRNIKAIASDNKEGPWKRARQNVENYRLETEIQVKLGDGLETIESQVDTIVISGMGGQNMIGIFKRNLEKLKQIETVILSPNNDVMWIRKFMINQGYFIADEKMVEDKNIIYTILKFKKGKRSYRKKEMYFGPILLKRNSDLFQKYWEKELKRKEITLQLLPKKYVVKRYHIQREIKLIQNR